MAAKNVNIPNWKIYFYPLFLLMILGACTGTRQESSPEVISTPAWDQVEVQLGKGPLGGENRKAGSWQLDDFSFDEDSLFGKLTVNPLPTHNQSSTFEDFLIVELQGNYVWPQYGDISHEVLEKVYLKPSNPGANSPVFIIADDIPPIERLRQYSAMELLPLKSLQIHINWIRLFSVEVDESVTLYSAEIACLAKTEDSFCEIYRLGQLPPNLTGFLASDSSFTPDDIDWVRKNTRLPTQTPIPTRNPDDYPPPMSANQHDPYPAPETSTPIP